jgi:hypothetical protein
MAQQLIQVWAQKREEAEAIDFLDAQGSTGGWRRTWPAFREPALHQRCRRVEATLCCDGGKPWGGRGDGGGPPVGRQHCRQVALLEREQPLEHLLQIGSRTCFFSN